MDPRETPEAWAFDCRVRREKAVQIARPGVHCRVSIRRRATAHELPSPRMKPTTGRSIGPGAGGCGGPAQPHLGEGVVMREQKRALTVAIIALGLPVAFGLLGAGVYAVFNSTNGAGTAALLTVGSLTLFVVLYHDRIRSMEFGGAKVQFALKIKDRFKEAFELRLAGNYEQAEDKLEFAFSEFARGSDKRWKEYQIAEKYQDSVREKLEEIVKGDDFKGRVRKTASSLSLLPLIDLVMDFDGSSLQAALTARGLTLCRELTEHLQQHDLRAGVIVRPG